MKHLARIISFLTNPIFILFPAPYLLLYRFGYSHYYALRWTLFSLIFFLLAGLFVIYEVRHKVFSDMDVSRKEQRPLLFSILGGLTLIYLFSLFVLDAPLIMFIAVWGFLLAIVLTSLITLKIKASLHVGVATAVLITLMVLYKLPPYILLSIFVIAWSRIEIRRHTYSEVISGFILGCLITFFMYILLQYMHLETL